MIQVMSSASPFQSHPMAFKLPQRATTSQVVRFGNDDGPPPMVQSQQSSGFRILLGVLGSVASAGVFVLGLGGLRVLPKPLQDQVQPYVDKAEGMFGTAQGIPTPIRIAPHSTAAMPAPKEPGFLLIDDKISVPVAKRNPNGSYTLPWDEIAVRTEGDADSGVYTMGGLTVTFKDPWVVALGRTYILADKTRVIYSEHHGGLTLYVSPEGTLSIRTNTGRKGGYSPEAGTITWPDGTVEELKD